MRNISWSTYGTAFVISALLFSVGVLIGVQLTQGVNNQLQSDLDALKAKTAELEVLALMNLTDSAQLCGVLSQQLTGFDRETTEFGDKLYFLEKNRGKGDATVLKLKLDYNVMQLRDYLLVKRLNDECSAKRDVILYFYSNENCADCERQGAMGPELKKERPGVMIYAFDAGLGSPAITALRGVYGVAKYPTLVVNGQKLEGYRTKAEVEAYLSSP